MDKEQVLKTKCIGKPEVHGKGTSSAILSTTNATGIYLGLNSGYGEEIPATNRLRSCMALAVSILIKLRILNR